MNRVVHFEIHAEDPERAAAFYSGVFGWKIQKWDAPGMDYWMVITGEKTGDDKWPGINGGLLRRSGTSMEKGMSPNAFVCTIDVADIDAIIPAIEKAGGGVALPKMQVQGVGWLAYCFDTEANIFGLMQSDK